MVNVLSEKTAEGILRQVAPGWRDFMSVCFEDKRFANIINTVVMDKTRLCPKPTELFRVMAMEPKDIRVLILGQD